MKYTRAMIEAIEMEAENVILTSGCPTEDPCPNDNPFECDAEL